MNSREDLVFHGLVGALTAGAIFGASPYAAAVALALVFGHRIADKYFHDSLHDESRKTIAQLKIDVATIKNKQSTFELKNALGGKNG